MPSFRASSVVPIGLWPAGVTDPPINIPNGDGNATHYEGERSAQAQGERQRHRKKVPFFRTRNTVTPDLCRRGDVMSEPELMQGVFSSIQVVISLFSTFFTLVSAYIAGLYFFLNRAPMALKLLAFFLLSIGLIFLGGAAITQQRLQVELLAAWAKISSATIAVDAVLRNPLPILPPLGWSLYEIGLHIGWLTSLCAYLALGYMTFFHRWKVGPKEN